MWIWPTQNVVGHLRDGDGRRELVGAGDRPVGAGSAGGHLAQLGAGVIRVRRGHAALRIPERHRAVARIREEVGVVVAGRELGGGDHRRRARRSDGLLELPEGEVEVLSRGQARAQPARAAAAARRRGRPAGPGAASAAGAACRAPCAGPAARPSAAAAAVAGGASRSAAAAAPGGAAGSAAAAAAPGGAAGSAAAARVARTFGGATRGWGGGGAGAQVGSRDQGEGEDRLAVSRMGLHGERAAQQEACQRALARCDGDEPAFWARAGVIGRITG